MVVAVLIVVATGWLARLLLGLPLGVGLIGLVVALPLVVRAERGLNDAKTDLRLPRYAALQTHLTLHEGDGSFESRPGGYWNQQGILKRGWWAAIERHHNCPICHESLW